MISKKTPQYLPGLVLGLGFAGCWLNLALDKFCVDEKGLLVATHPVCIAIWALTALAAALCLLLSGSEEKEPGKLSCLGEFLGALGIVMTLIQSLGSARTPLDGIHLGVTVVAAAGLVAAGVMRLKGRGANLLYFAGTTVFFALHVVVRYRVWSAHPQLLDYIFSVLGALSMLCFSYLRICPDKFRLRRTVGFLGCFFCLCALGAGYDPWFYLGGGLWMLLTAGIPGEEV